MVDKLRVELDFLHGKRCAKVAGTSGVGSMVILLFGETHTKVLALPSFPPVTYDDAELAFLLDFAFWQLKHSGILLCSSSSPNGTDSEMELGIKQIEGRLVTAVTLEEPSLNLTLCFDEDFAFEVVCNQLVHQQHDDNYHLRSARGVLIVGPRSEVRFECHSSNA